MELNIISEWDALLAGLVDEIQRKAAERQYQVEDRIIHNMSSRSLNGQVEII